MKILGVRALIVIVGILLSARGWASPPGSGGQQHFPGLFNSSSFPNADSVSSSAWVDSCLASMTLEEKIGQVVMGWAYASYLSTESAEYDRMAPLVRDQKLGGLVMFQGDVYEEAMILNRLQGLAKIPLLISADLERGLAMRVRRATYFPDAMAIGATRTTEYAYKAALATAREARALGIHQNYAPVADVNSNPANPVINTRAFSDNPALASGMVDAYVRGTNDGGMLSTAKHFPGHGETGIDSHLDLPVVQLSRNHLDDVDLAVFKRAIASGVKSVMVGHLSIPSLDSTAGLPATLSYAVTTELLRNTLGFRGLVVTDAMVMEGVAKGHSVAESSVRAFNAGADIVLLPGDESIALTALLSAVRRGEISQERLNRSVQKILAAKQSVGLDRNRFVDPAKISDEVATREHWNLARQIARAALTVVKNERNLLPLPTSGMQKVALCVASDVDYGRSDVNRPGYPYPDEIVGAYFVQQIEQRYPKVDVVRLMPGSNELDFQSARATMDQADIIILPVFAKVRTSSGRIGLPQHLKEFIASICGRKKPTVLIAFGNPYLIEDFDRAHALLCAYGDAEVMVDAAVGALFGEIPVRGRLPVTVSKEFPFGSGIEFQQVRLRRDDPLVVGADPGKLMDIDGIMARAIRDSAFPGAQVIVARDGVILYDKSFGTYSYDPISREITRASVFDLASLTKVVATTPAVMRLYDEGKLNLDDPVSKYIPQFAVGAKTRVTIRHLLTHSSGLPPFRRLWEFCKTPAEALDSVYATGLVAAPGDTMIYSDLGMITLGKIVETLTGTGLNEFMKKEFYEPLGMRNTMFTPPESWRSLIAPTEVDSSWRKRLVQGTVHDENADFLGGVSGHAGLFSSADDVAIFMQMMMNGGMYGGVRYLKESTVREFTRKQSVLSSRALGWDTKSPVGSSAGEKFSPLSFGHTGFTGTSLWADPERNLFVVLLTNRVHPTRQTRGIFTVRPALHNAVIESLLPGSAR